MINMQDAQVLIRPEDIPDAQAIKKLHELVFGPGRFARTAYRIREKHGHIARLGMVAECDGVLAGSIRFSQLVDIADGLLLGPLAVQEKYAGRGIGLSLMTAALKRAEMEGFNLVVLVGDLPYYARAGFSLMPVGRIKLPGPVDPARILFRELQTQV
jgi:predicted N-acetyltransferase YhbS